MMRHPDMVIMAAGVASAATFHSNAAGIITVAVFMVILRRAIVVTVVRDLRDTRRLRRQLRGQP